jgi:DNA (cytosine-5)-methyltransferase 1
MKPAYRIFTVAEARAAARRGLTHVGAFVGGGGSRLGFEMAGFRTLWSNEYDKHAIATYLANFPGTLLDTRSILDVSADDILKATGLAPGDLDVFEASPPCTKFSTSGKGAKSFDGVTERLFFTTIDLLGGLRPRAFCFENVAALARRSANRPYFNEVMRRTRALGYRVRARILDAHDFGAPQRRERLMIIGLRNDLGAEARFPEPQRWRYSVRDALPHVARVEGWNHQPFTQSADLPFPTLCASSQQAIEARLSGGTVRPFGPAEFKAVCGFPPDFALDGPEDKQRARLGNSVLPPFAFAVASALRDTLMELTRKP